MTEQPSRRSSFGCSFRDRGSHDDRAGYAYTRRHERRSRHRRRRPSRISPSAGKLEHERARLLAHDGRPVHVAIGMLRGDLTTNPARRARRRPRVFSRARYRESPARRSPPRRALVPPRTESAGGQPLCPAPPESSAPGPIGWRHSLRTVERARSCAARALDAKALISGADGGPIPVPGERRRSAVELFTLLEAWPGHGRLEAKTSEATGRRDTSAMSPEQPRARGFRSSRSPTQSSSGSRIQSAGRGVR